MQFHRNLLRVRRARTKASPEATPLHATKVQGGSNWIRQPVVRGKCSPPFGKFNRFAFISLKNPDANCADPLLIKAPSLFSKEAALSTY